MHPGDRLVRQLIAPGERPVLLGILVDLEPLGVAEDLAYQRVAHETGGAVARLAEPLGQGGQLVVEIGAAELDPVLALGHPGHQGGSSQADP